MNWRNQPLGVLIYVFLTVQNLFFYSTNHFGSTLFWEHLSREKVVVCYWKCKCWKQAIKKSTYRNLIRSSKLFHSLSISASLSLSLSISVSQSLSFSSQSLSLSVSQALNFSSEFSSLSLCLSLSQSLRD